MCLFFMIVCEGACQWAAVLCDCHPGAERLMSAGSFHLGEDAWMGERPHVILQLAFLSDPKNILCLCYTKDLFLKVKHLDDSKC